MKVWLAALLMSCGDYHRQAALFDGELLGTCFMFKTEDGKRFAESLPYPKGYHWAPVEGTGTHVIVCPYKP